MARSVYNRLISRIRKTKNGCWEWLGATNNAGYGLIHDERHLTGGMMTVHRVMARHVGLDIEHNEIQHTCLNKLCVNPNHLVMGDPRTRTDRLIKKYGSDYIRPKEKYYKCEHCNRTTHFVWFKRIHKDCYPGMLDGLHELLRKKHK